MGASRSSSTALAYSASTVSKYEKLVEKLLGRDSDANFTFSELRYILQHLGFVERVHGSHHVYRSAGLPGVNLVLQPDGKDAKPYQVAQVRRAVLMHQSGGADGQV
jgi:hypothetical protein